MTVWREHRDLGLVTRAEALADGMTDRAIAWRVRSGRWQRLHPGIYAAHPGPLDWRARASGVVLCCGPGAALCDRSAAYLHDIVDEPGPLFWVVVPEARRVLPPADTRLRRARSLPPSGPRWPPRTSVETTLVDLARDASADDVAGWLARAVQRRVTTADRLLAELGSRSRHPQRGLVDGIITDIRSGVESTLELHFVRGVLRPHRLPLGEAQMPLSQVHPAFGATRADRGYPQLRALVELDGARHHQGPTLVLDRLKSNRAAALGWVSVRYGWAETVEHPCRTAGELAGLFWARGWRGTPRPCSPTCPLATLERQRPA